MRIHTTKWHDQKPFRSSLTTVFACLLLLASNVGVTSTTYGIFDARTMAMGGAAVASANNDNAQFYNSALLAFNDEIEERTQDSRFWFPMIIPQIGAAASDAEEIFSDDMVDDISRSVSNYNVAPTMESAQAVVNASSNLNGALSSIAGKELFADIYIGMALSEPGKFQGAGFFLGTRLLGSGQPTVSDTDLATLQAYQQGMLFVASGGTQGTEQPDIFDANGALVDPGASFDSSVDAAGAAIIEVGVAMSSQFDLFGQSFAAGWSYKAVEVDTFEDSEQFSDRRIDIDQNSNKRITLNFDVGLVKDFDNGWRVGLAVKDIVPHDYRTSLGTKIKLRPRPRAGVAYQLRKLQLALDADLVKNQPLANERASQEVAFGAEWIVIDALRLRGGFRHDFAGRRGGVASVGAGTLWKRLAFDLAYSEGNETRAAAFQIGVSF